MKKAFAFVVIVSLVLSMFAVFTPKARATGLVISSVSPIGAINLQTIDIKGSEFGNTWPQTVAVGDGSVDTVVSSSTPCIDISNLGDAPDAWAAGVENVSNGVFCAIGLYLTSWSDNEIVLGGFGSALNTNGQGPWNMALGDTLDVAVFTLNGEAHYNLTIAPFSLLWTRNTNQAVQGMAAVDIMGGGKRDVVYSDWSGIINGVDSNNNTLWNFTTGWYNDLRIGDLQGDGNNEIVIGSADTHVYCLNGVTGQQIWNYSTAELAGHSMSLADIYGNGKEEVVMGEWDSNVYSASPANMYILSPDGNLLWKYAFPDDVVTSSADVNNDGKAEIFAYYGRPQISSTGYLHRFNSDGTINWTVSIPGCAWMVPIFLDVNGDGVKELITCRSSDNAILVFNAIDGSLLNTISNSYGWLWWAGDLNNDSQVEFLTNNGNTLYALDFGGNKLWESQLSSGVYDLKVADLNGDGKKEIVVGTTGFLRVLSSQGSTIWSTSMMDNVGNIQIADIDGDGLPDIVAGTGLPWPDQSVPESVSVFKNELPNDNTPPTTNLTIGEPNYVDPVSNVTYVTQYTPFTLEATDNVSGVSYTAYHIYNFTFDGGWQNYTTQFVLDPLKDGNYTIGFYSVDKAGNKEATNSVNVMLHWLYGDINHDGKVSLDDLVVVAEAYHSVPGDQKWNQNADMAPPWGIISLSDLVTVAVHYGQTFHP